MSVLTVADAALTSGNNHLKIASLEIQFNHRATGGLSTAYGFCI